MRTFRHLREPEHYFYTQRHASEAGNRIRVQRVMDTLLSVAKCPLCGVALTLRMGRRGPYFQCGCTKE